VEFLVQFIGPAMPGDAAERALRESADHGRLFASLATGANNALLLTPGNVGPVAKRVFAPGSHKWQVGFAFPTATLAREARGGFVAPVSTFTPPPRDNPRPGMVKLFGLFTIVGPNHETYHGRIVANRSVPVPPPLSAANPDWVSVSAQSQHNETFVKLTWEILASQPGTAQFYREGNSSVATLQRDSKSKLHRTTASIELTRLSPNGYRLVSKKGYATITENFTGNFRELADELLRSKNLSATTVRETPIELCRVRGHPFTVMVVASPPPPEATRKSNGAAYGFGTARGLSVWGMGLIAVGAVVIGFGGVALLVWLLRKSGASKRTVLLVLSVPLMLFALALAALVGMWGIRRDFGPGVGLARFEKAGPMVLESNYPAPAQPHPPGRVQQTQNGFRLQLPPAQLASFELFIRQADDSWQAVPSLTALVATSTNASYHDTLFWTLRRSGEAETTNQLWFWTVSANNGSGRLLPQLTDHGTNFTHALVPGETLDWWQLAAPAQTVLKPGEQQIIPLFRTHGTATPGGKHPREAFLRVRCEPLPASLKVMPYQQFVEAGLAAHALLEKVTPRAITPPIRPADKAPDASVKGRLLDDQGKPLAQRRLLVINPIMEATHQQPQIFAEIRTGDDGGFSAALPVAKPFVVVLPRNRSDNGPGLKENEANEGLHSLQQFIGELGGPMGQPLKALAGVMEVRVEGEKLKVHFELREVSLSMTQPAPANVAGLAGQTVHLEWSPLVNLEAVGAQWQITTAKPAWIWLKVNGKRMGQQMLSPESGVHRGGVILRLERQGQAKARLGYGFAGMSTPWGTADLPGTYEENAAVFRQLFSDPKSGPATTVRNRETELLRLHSVIATVTIAGENEAPGLEIGTPVAAPPPPRGPRLQFRLVAEANDASAELLADHRGQQQFRVRRDILLDETDVAEAKASGKGSSATIDVVFTLNGGERFAEITSANRGKQLAVIFDGKVIFAPVIHETITAGRAAIHGNFTPSEAREIAQALKAKAGPRFKALIACFNGKVDSGSSCSGNNFQPDGTFHPQGKLTCGYPGKVSAVEWAFVEQRGGKDAYRFTRRFPADGDAPSTATKVIEFSDSRIVVFEDEFQVVVIGPPNEKKPFSGAALPIPERRELKALRAIALESVAEAVRTGELYILHEAGQTPHELTHDPETGYRILVLPVGDPEAFKLFNEAMRAYFRDQKAAKAKAK
jgi:hypothetical protein